MCSFTPGAFQFGDEFEVYVGFGAGFARTKPHNLLNFAPKPKYTLSPPPSLTAPLLPFLDTPRFVRRTPQELPFRLALVCSRLN